MDEAIALVLHGCKLAKELEANLLQNQNPRLLSKSCHEIISTLLTATERLQQSLGDTKMEDNLFLPATSHSSPGLQVMTAAEQWTSMPIQRPLQQVSTDHDLFKYGGDYDQPIDDVLQPGQAEIGSSTSHKPRTRKSDGEKTTVRVAAPVMGNTEAPPEDGFAWRKYGQKEILGSKFPRAYYRCTHQKMYGCAAKKQVQRLDSDPSIYQVTYRAEHTCHMSSTAPSVAPPLPPPWMEGGTGAVGDDAVADMADAMFNSTSSNTKDNSIEFIFHSF